MICCEVIFQEPKSESSYYWFATPPRMGESVEIRWGEEGYPQSFLVVHVVNLERGTASGTAETGPVYFTIVVRDSSVDPRFA